MRKDPFYNARLARSVFVNLLWVYLVLVIFDAVSNGLIRTIINTNYIFAVLLAGVPVIGVLEGKIGVPGAGPEREGSVITPGYFFYISLLSIAGGLVVYYKTMELVWMRYHIAFITGALIYSVGIMVLKGDGQATPDKVKRRG